MSEIAQKPRLTRSEILTRLADLRQEFGVTSLEVFGSTARDAAGPTSDVDILVEFEQPVALFHFFALQDYLESLLDGQPVDLVLRNSVLDDVKERIYGEAISI